MSRQQPTISDKERDAWIECIEGGMSIYATAKRFGRSRDAVAREAKRRGYTPDDSSTRAATQARVQYAAAQRIELINKAFAKVERLLDLFPDDPAAARDMRDLATALGILIDKRRLEDGEATERAETVTIIDDIPRE